MHSLRRNIERFFARNSEKGIPNLMLFVAIGNIIVFAFSLFDPSNVLYFALQFDWNAILHRGEVWRLVTFIFASSAGMDLFNMLFFALMLFFYFQIGRMMEAQWGRLKFNAYYFLGILILDAAALLLRVNITNEYLNLGLILSFATLMPEMQVYFFGIIPFRMKYLAWFYLFLLVYEMLTTPFPALLMPLFGLANYFLFFGADVLGLLPQALQRRRRTTRTKSTFTPPKPPRRKQSEPNPHWADGYRRQQSPHTQQKAQPYRHKCTVCGRTDVDHPELEFRYCSRCKGYYCYCQDHINNHVHIQ